MAANITFFSERPPRTSKYFGKQESKNSKKEDERRKKPARLGEKWRNKVPYFSLLTAHFSSSSPTILPSPPNSRLEEISKSFRGSAERWHWNISLDAAGAIILAQALSCWTSLGDRRKFSKLKYRMLRMKTKNWSRYFEKRKWFVYFKIKSEWKRFRGGGDCQRGKLIFTSCKMCCIELPRDYLIV